jgi:membrane protease YdiL (CAAX protease family)
LDVEHLRQVGLRHRLSISLVVLLLWVAVVAVAGHFSTIPERSVLRFVSQGLAWPIVCAVAFLALVVLTFQWMDIGLAPFRVMPALRLMWLPLIYLCAFGAVVATLGLPPIESLLFIIINTFFVGVSEEVMFRGILFSGLRSRLSLWPSIWICCLLFGLVHVLNAVQTGNWTTATLQAVAAFQTGTILMALRLRTGSLYPVILLHAIWDCLPLLIATHAGDINPDQPLPAYAYLAPLFVLPNFLYALYLLRPKGLAKAGVETVKSE